MLMGGGASDDWLRLQALTLLEAMTEAGGEVSPDVVSYNTCLKACGSAAKLDQGIQVALLKAGSSSLPPAVMSASLPATCCWSLLLSKRVSGAGVQRHGQAGRVAKHHHLWDVADCRKPCRQLRDRQAGVLEPL